MDEKKNAVIPSCDNIKSGVFDVLMNVQTGLVSTKKTYSRKEDPMFASEINDVPLW